MDNERTITTTLVIDTSGFDRAMERIREAFRPLAEAMAQAGRQIGRLMQTMREAANDPVYIAGLEGRYFVRAGMDPAYRHPERLDALVQGILTGAEQGMDDDAPWWGLITRENRRLVALAAIRGWAASYGEPGLYVAHRAWGQDRVQVSCG